MSLSNMQSLITVACIFAAAFTIRGIVLSRRSRNPKRLPLPPGPRGVPIMGNMSNIPKTKPWEGYQKLCEEYGGMVYLEVLGTKLLVVSRMDHAEELLEKRSVNTSDRPTIPMVELTQRTGDNIRRAFHQYLNHNAVGQYHPIMYEEVEIFTRKLRDNPKDFLEHVQAGTGPLSRPAEALVQGFSEASTQGRFLVNTFPILRHVPAWFPGAGWRVRFNQLAVMSWDLLHNPWDDAKKDLTEGKQSVHPSMAASLMNHLGDDADPDFTLERSDRWTAEDVARNACAQAYLAGADTTVSSASVMILALANNPHVQKKAQAEIDRVVGPNRIPSVSDRDSLPYLHAIVKEVNRYYTVVPLGVPHTVTEDEEYNGYFIPKDTMILPNSWAMMHDPNTFEKPFEFIPERFLTKDGEFDESVPGPEYAAFGFGRRICPGRYFSDDAFFAMAASVLTQFDITPSEKDVLGNPVQIKLELMDHTVAKPSAFKVDITPRPGRENLVM
ncbi:cytochrome P450 98A3 [Ephemerocybe angulata]|uniref:Cytochrome P450 98A3 n=1 Tax=Ephemerocybe angulata TaxID=980116 RepID=A0A8H6HVX9_9AGAR|nr:cytochrome P450 98A3 [Tulosesus angulatus]